MVGQDASEFAPEFNPRRLSNYPMSMHLELVADVQVSLESV